MLRIMRLLSVNMNVIGFCKLLEIVWIGLFYGSDEVEVKSWDGIKVVIRMMDVFLNILVKVFCVCVCKRLL